MDPIRILIADDHALVRSGLSVVLNSQPDFEVVGEAATGRETIERVVALKPDILLLDIAMPDGNGLDAAQEIRRKAPDVRIIVLTMYDDEGYLRQFLAIGAAGYVLKKAADTELADAIRAVNRGESFVYPSLMPRLIDSYLGREAPQVRSPRSDSLSPREKEVMRLVALGYTSQQIADRLVIGTSTVDTHRSRIMEKLGLTSRAQLVRYALARGLLTDDE
jgi:two-component system response regulator NreC